MSYQSDVEALRFALEARGVPHTVAEIERQYSLYCRATYGSEWAKVIDGSGHMEDFLARFQARAVAAEGGAGGAS